ncbi:MAG: leucyl aminopeptidase [Ignavibacteriales bacterium]|nr:leucyl aminopeptidase [Ignavibacteriales bacterium]
MNTHLSISSTPFHKIKSEAVALFLCEEKQARDGQLARLSDKVRAFIAPAIDLNDFKGKEGETVLLYTDGVVAAPRIILVGIGKSNDLTLEKVRRGAAQAARKAAALEATTLALLFPDERLLPEGTNNLSDLAQALTEGALLSLYKFDRYLSGAKEKKKVSHIIFLADPAKVTTRVQSAIRIGKILATAVCHARDLENTPGSDLTPSTLADEARRAGRKFGFAVTVLDPKKIVSLRMGGVVAVSRGSTQPPRFIMLEYGKKFKSRGTHVLVGKGVTFDSGGISIKSSAGMAEMKMDMSGAAAVLGTFEAAAQLAIPIHLVGLIPAVENMPSGSALKPGDILRHYNGKTSEVDNTDAEGRLILADALGFADRYTPTVVIDIATLTGACVVALGHVAAGMLGNNQNEMDAIKRAGERTYERVWQMPMFDEYEKLVKSEIADVKNVGGRWGGTITAAFFLKKFIGNYPWVHLDIAGTAMLEENTDYATRGGSGFGVRLMTDYLTTKAIAASPAKRSKSKSGKTNDLKK